MGWALPLIPLHPSPMHDNSGSFIAKDSGLIETERTEGRAVVWGKDSAQKALTGSYDMAC